MRYVYMLLSLAILIVCGDQTYQLVWSDEFNGNSLDLTKWQYEVNCDGGGNNELECYTNSPDNLQVKDGYLNINVKKQNLNGKKYTSARINTQKSAAWKYGRFDTRAKLPNGIYLWPALWMMPRDSVYGSWAASGEIDIMENHGGNDFEQQSTIHYGGSWPNNVYHGSGAQNMNFNLTADFHIYTLLWTPDSLQFLVDNVPFHQETLQRNFWSGQGSNPYTANGQPFDQQFFYIINCAVGGGFFGSNANALTDQQAQNWGNPTFTIDYVRVSQLQDPINVNPSPVASDCPSGSCNGGPCCMDQKNQAQCYDTTVYNCVVDQYNGLKSLCQSGFQVCNAACFNTTLYGCTRTGGLGAPFVNSGKIPAGTATLTQITTPQPDSDDNGDDIRVKGHAVAMVPFCVLVMALIIIF